MTAVNLVNPAASPDVLPACFALLDDSGASAAAPRSRLYTTYAGTLSCQDVSMLPAWFAALQQALEQGLHAVALISYELGAALHDIAPREPAAACPESGLNQILLFQQCQYLSKQQADDWLAQTVARLPNYPSFSLKSRSVRSQASLAASAL